MTRSWRQNYYRYKDYFLDIVSLYQKKQNIKTFIELILTLVAVTVFSVFALKPTAIAIGELVNQIKAREELVVQMDAKIKNIQIAQANVQTNKDKLALLDTALPIGPSPQDLIRQLEGVLGTSNTSIIGISLSDIQIVGINKNIVSGETPAVEFSFSISGQYQNIVKLLNSIENTRRPNILSSVTISPEDSSDNAVERTDNLIFSVSAKAPYLDIHNENSVLEQNK